MGLDNVLRGRKRYLDGGNCTVSVFENQASASSGSLVLDIDEIEWEEGYDRTDEEGEGKAAVFDRFRPVYVCERIWRQYYLELF